MRLAYLDCFCGISGDMMLAALIDAGADPRALRKMLRAVAADFRLTVKDDQSRGFAGKRVRVTCAKKQPERRLRQIEKMIANSGLPRPVVEKSLAVFKNLAKAEARAHGIKPEQVHFHEVGAIDAIVDVVGSAAGLYLLEAEEVICSPLPVAGGEVKCAHGVLPLPAPAVLELLKGVPVVGASGDKELVTPTGAALAVSMASGFGPLPPMTIERHGVGLGSHELPDRPNLMRLILGTAAGRGETLLQLETVIDDMNPQHFDFLLERLHAAGALEVVLVPVQAKKNRPGSLLRALVRPRDRDRVSEELFAHSTTLGLREYEVKRRSLSREIRTVTTRFGRVRVKTALRPGQGPSFRPEFEDLKKAARAAGVTLEAVEREALKAVLKSGDKRVSAARRKS